MLHRPSFDAEIKSYREQQNAAVELIQIISNLWYNQAVELILFREQLVDEKVSVILNHLRETTILTGNTMTIFDLLAVARVLEKSALAPARIDIGQLAAKVTNRQINSEDLSSFILNELQGIAEWQELTPRDVVLYGFGRIGRLLARELINKSGSGKQLRLRAIVTRDPNDAKSLLKRAALLKSDSIHGEFEGEVYTDPEKNALIINGITVNVISAKQPEDIDYTTYGINNALVIDNTGAFRDEKELARHLVSKGASQVLLTAPGKGVPNIVYGVNESTIDLEKQAIFSAASCTTNAIAPVLAVLEEKIGILKGHIETIHSYTNDQNLVDNMHKKSRRGRAAALNMVITETGAGSAVSKVLPTLTGKLTSNAIRVPVPNGSLAILNLELTSATSLEQINTILKTSALEGNLVEQIKFSSNDELVSTDIIGTTAAAVVDGPATIVSADGKNIVLYVWYDNEYGYSHQVMRLSRHIAGVRRYTYY
ncbi:MAG: type glyceraldehyde-3-phosphate dehydrogenase [Sphingobacterium sp.]|jgi:glyceraldehyde 3-phosphate dehydrogenase|uniref:glyceraldehyde-3-phosphate dehydrogenase n=1 Tax=unclassified Sphingobacterium TaxID=2609468 RepID=UPI000987D166|nr:glyceraldehyde-3-phosphate dehydrogenase [Sphingobacterium sp. CZ-UAM]MDF2518280.1 type glyceraldehyde-3-phosphate dehydrogenase [Sphingobacterium sp.]OOG16583.1 type I glyceraldehyde-3-phosphate dehydrogenase [Sphingobacterium sp. CZ-UAM]